VPVKDCTQKAVPSPLRLLRIQAEDISRKDRQAKSRKVLILPASRSLTGW